METDHCGTPRRLLALSGRQMMVAWTREAATEETRCRRIETGLCVEPRSGVSSPLAAPLSPPVPLLCSRAKVPFHIQPAPAVRALLPPSLASSWPRGPLLRRHPQVLTYHVHINPVSYVLLESLIPKGKPKFREGKAFTQHHTASGTQDGLAHCPRLGP